MRIGEWSIHPATDQMSRHGELIRLESRTMRLLLCLAEHAGAVVSIDDLLSKVWPGVIVTSDSVYQAVASLRGQLGDNPKQPTYIATVPRRGYRLVAKVEVPVEEPSQPAAAPIAGAPPQESAHRPALVLAVAALVLIVGFGAYWMLHRYSPAPTARASLQTENHRQSIAVLPLLDLTDAMNEEPFADGMTEELIDKLSKMPELKVASPTDSFFYKDKKVAIADVAKALKVTYVMDGSVRKSGASLRVAARLVRVDDGFVVWSETYDRPYADKLAIQDEIANRAANALRRTIN
ncbi:winged helix-turn-helix domain-containing protein [Dyella subtropica]|uniref:winged helix-turn-helix domain-containing protein n=1 Tax=Dyella subtropica TaxID=2992127 RepID=UPI00225058AA|nr:winged helix-turn-helix domain-containing protein [Dyella subtropica]